MKQYLFNIFSHDAVVTFQPGKVTLRVGEAGIQSKKFNLGIAEQDFFQFKQNLFHDKEFFRIIQHMSIWLEFELAFYVFKQGWFPISGNYFIDVEFADSRNLFIDLRQQIFIHFRESTAVNKLKQIAALADIFIKFKNCILAISYRTDA